MKRYIAILKSEDNRSVGVEIYAHTMEEAVRKANQSKKYYDGIFHIEKIEHIEYEGE